MSTIDQGEGPVSGMPRRPRTAVIMIAQNWDTPVIKKQGSW